MSEDCKLFLGKIDEDDSPIRSQVLCAYGACRLLEWSSISSNLDVQLGYYPYCADT